MAGMRQLRQLVSRWGERVLHCNGDGCAGATARVGTNFERRGQRLRARPALLLPPLL